MAKFCVVEKGDKAVSNVLNVERRIIRDPIFKVVKGFRRRHKRKNILRH